ncbi:MAG TPA: hypothetical protein VIY66_02955 [Candidatus Acidoferrales bacterium]
MGAAVAWSNSQRWASEMSSAEMDRTEGASSAKVIAGLGQSKITAA